MSTKSLVLRNFGQELINISVCGWRVLFNVTWFSWPKLVCLVQFLNVISFSRVKRPIKGEAQKFSERNENSVRPFFRNGRIRICRTYSRRTVVSQTNNRYRRELADVFLGYLKESWPCLASQTEPQVSLTYFKTPELQRKLLAVDVFCAKVILYFVLRRACIAIAIWIERQSWQLKFRNINSCSCTNNAPKRDVYELRYRA